MDRTHVLRRLLRPIAPLAAVAASLLLAFPAPAFADQLEQHDELASKFIKDMHADPLVADCAAHANFVASTSTAFDHVDFPPGSFDSPHASVTPWNDSFDEAKQRVKVDIIVTVEGLGVRQDGRGEPDDLKFRCGYVGTQMLAFSWNDPVPAAKPRGEPAATKPKNGIKGKSSGTKPGKTPKKPAASKSGGGSAGSTGTTKPDNGNTAPAQPVR